MGCDERGTEGPLFHGGGGILVMRVFRRWRRFGGDSVLVIDLKAPRDGRVPI
jgi:hypothetical protein